MAEPFPYLFESVTLIDGQDSQNTYTVELIDDDSVSITNEPVESTAEASDTTINGFDKGIEFITFDLSVLGDSSTDSFINKSNEGQRANRSNIIVNVRGSDDALYFNDVDIYAFRPFDEYDRDHVAITAKGRDTVGVLTFAEQEGIGFWVIGSTFVVS